MPQTLFDKLWQPHVVLARDDGRTLLYVDRHLLQDGSAPAFAMLRQRGLTPRSSARAFATPDHYIPTHSRNLADVRDPEAARMAHALRLLSF
jgi:3-isopropylmalate/(R)-2-methylmalate dehydratase large subunit